MRELESLMIVVHMSLMAAGDGFVITEKLPPAPTPKPGFVVTDDLPPAKMEAVPLTQNQPREVVLLVPNFPCGACQYLEAQILTLPNVRLRKVVDMTRPSWPWLSVPDTGHEWGYYHPVTKQPLTAANVAAILKQFPPVEKPAKRGAK